MRKQLFSLLFFCQAAFAQNTDTAFLYPSALQPEQQKAWDSIKSIWQKTVYQKVEKKNKINITDCYQCGAFYVDAEISIDSTGKLTYDVVAAKKCFANMSLKMENELMRYFLQLIFPKHCRNIKIRDRLGWLLKC
jgi:hypothetical protein